MSEIIEQMPLIVPLDTTHQMKLYPIDNKRQMNFKRPSYSADPHVAHEASGSASKSASDVDWYENMD